MKDGPTTPLCATLFLSIFFLVPPPPSPSRFSIFFFIPFLGLAGTSGLHCLKTFVCASEHVCSSGIFWCFIVGHTTIDLFVHLFFLSWLHYCSIVLCLIVQQQRTHLPATYPASVFDNHPHRHAISDNAFLLLLLLFCGERTCDWIDICDKSMRHWFRLSSNPFSYYAICDKIWINYTFSN